MPVMNGIQATEYIKRVKPKIIVIAVTSLSDKKWRDMMFKVGAEDFFIKPINKNLFLNKLDIAKTLIKFKSNNKTEIVSNKQSSSIDINSDMKIIFNLHDEGSMRFIWNFIVVKNRDLFNQEFVSVLLVSLFDIISTFAVKSDGISLLLIYSEKNKKLTLVLKGLNDIKGKSEKIKVIIEIKFKENDFLDILSKVETKYEKEFLLLKVNLLDEDKNFDDEDIDFIDFDFDDEEDDNDMEDYNVSHLGKSAIEFLEEYDNKELEDLIDDLNYIEENIYIIIDELYEDNLEKNSDFIVEVFSSYGKFFNIFCEFVKVSTALNLLAVNIEKVKFDDAFIGNKTKHIIAEFIKAIFQDLISWKNAVFINKDTVDVCYMNASIYNSYLQLDDFLKKLQKN